MRSTMAVNTTKLISLLFLLATVSSVFSSSFSDSDSDSDSDLINELVSLRSNNESGAIHLDDHGISKFLTSASTPRPYSILVFFDATQLHSKNELRLQELRREFGIVSASFLANNNNNGSNRNKLFFCEIEFSQAQSSFQLFGVNTLPHIRLVSPLISNLRDESGQMDQSYYSRLAESMAEFVEQRTKLTVGPIQRPPLLSKPQIGIIVALMVISTPFIIKRILKGETLIHDLYHNIIRKMPMFIQDRKDPNKLVFLFWALILLFLSLFVQSSTAIYCGAEDCYALLNVSQDANASDIKRSYYKLSLKHHPDKNPDPESKKLFVKIATAYEILKDNETRSQYDYAIEHPEEVFYNTAQYYRAKYGHKSDPRAVLIGLLVVLSAFQYLNNVARYNEAIATVKRTPAYKNKLKALELERTGGVSNKKKGSKQIDQKLQEELSNELDLQIKGAEKPAVWELLGVRFVLLPYTIIKLLVWYSSWVWRYKVKKAPYSWEDASYLTRRSLGVSADAWDNLDEYRKEDLVQRRLWEKQNLENYFAEMRKDSKRRR